MAKTGWFQVDPGGSWHWGLHVEATDIKFPNGHISRFLHAPCGADAQLSVAILSPPANARLCEDCKLALIEAAQALLERS